MLPGAMTISIRKLVLLWLAQGTLFLVVHPIPTEELFTKRLVTQVLYEELRDAVIANSDQSVITIRDAAKTAKLIDACIKSSNEKRTIIF